MNYTDLFGYGLACASALTILPQMVHLIRKRNTEGLSFVMSLMGVTTMMFWSIYTLSIRDWPAFASSILPLLIWGVIYYYILLLSSDLHFKDSILPVTFWLLIMLLSFTSLLGLYGILAAIFSSLWSLPQLYKIIRERDFKGVSYIAFLALGIENICWVIYAILKSNLTYAFAPLFQGPATLYIALVVWRYKTSIAKRRPLP